MPQQSHLHLSIRRHFPVIFEKMKFPNAKNKTPNKITTHLPRLSETKTSLPYLMILVTEVSLISDLQLVNLSRSTILYTTNFFSTLQTISLRNIKVTHTSYVSFLYLLTKTYIIVESPEHVWVDLYFSWLHSGSVQSEKNCGKHHKNWPYSSPCWCHYGR